MEWPPTTQRSRVQSWPLVRPSRGSSAYTSVQNRNDRAHSVRDVQSSEQSLPRVYFKRPSVLVASGSEDVQAMPLVTGAILGAEAGIWPGAHHRDRPGDGDVRQCDQG